MCCIGYGVISVVGVLTFGKRVDIDAENPTGPKADNYLYVLVDHTGGTPFAPSPPRVCVCWGGVPFATCDLWPSVWPIVWPSVCHL